MRKALIATIVAVGLFAVGAFAANFDLTAEDTASGTDVVAACTDNVSVDFEEGFVDADNNWSVDEIILTLDTDNSCEGAELTVIVQDENDVQVDDFSIASVAFDTGSINVITLEPTDLTVAEVWNVAVLFDGQEVSQTAVSG